MDKINWGSAVKNGSIVAILIIAPFLLPIFHFSFDISLTLTVISLVFAILIGFFISVTTTNYLRLQSLISEGNSNLIKIFCYTKLIQPSFTGRIADIIDQYMIAILDFPFLMYVPNTKKEFNEIIKAAEEVNPMDDKGLAMFPYLQETKNDLYKINQEIFLTSKEIVSKRHWFIIITLSVLMATLVLSLRDGYWIFSLITGIFLTTIYQILILLKEIDNNTFLTDQLAYQNPQEVFRYIGKLEYYPETAIKNRWIKIPQENYRVGVYKNYPHSFDKEIKITKGDTTLPAAEIKIISPL